MLSACSALLQFVVLHRVDKQQNFSTRTNWQLCHWIFVCHQDCCCQILCGPIQDSLLPMQELFPFNTYFADAPGPLFADLVCGKVFNKINLAYATKKFICHQVQCHLLISTDCCLCRSYFPSPTLQMCQTSGFACHPFAVVRPYSSAVAASAGAVSLQNLLCRRSRDSLCWCGLRGRLGKSTRLLATPPDHVPGAGRVPSL